MSDIHYCVVCNMKMSKNDTDCPRCQRKAHLKDYTNNTFEEYKAGLLPRIAAIMLGIMELYLLFELITGKEKFKTLVLPLIIVLFVFLIFLMYSQSKIQIADDYVISNDYVAFYSDVISPEDNKNMSLGGRRDKSFTFYTLPPNVEEKDKITFAVSQLSFPSQYSIIVKLIKDKLIESSGRNNS